MHWRGEVQFLTSGLLALLLTSCAGIRTVPVQEVNEGVALVSGAEVLALILIGKAPEATRCIQLAVGPTAQMTLAIAPEGIPSRSLWALDFVATFACATEALWP